MRKPDNQQLEFLKALAMEKRRQYEIGKRVFLWVYLPVASVAMFFFTVAMVWACVSD
jgi:hypothetical protein